MNYGAANPHCLCFAIDHSDFDFAIGIGSSTHLDAHGERFSKDALRSMADQVNAKYHPMLVGHVKVDTPPGALVAAKCFKLPDGETAMGIVVVFHTSFAARVSFQIGQENHNWEDYIDLIDVARIIEEHELRMKERPDIEMSIEERLSAYLSSHIVHSDGKIEVRKQLVGSIKDLKIEVYANDHPPAHFHVTSKQRNINARFSVETLDHIDTKQGKISTKDKKLIKQFFKTNTDALETLRTKSNEYLVRLN